MTQSAERPRIVGLGEVLWDILPGGEQLGGAPANFAVACARLGANSAIASAVGNDPLGAEAALLLHEYGVQTSFLQQNRLRTGRVTVQIEDAGQPVYSIEQPSAWDALDWTEPWDHLAQCCDAVCFGTLAQRDPRSRATVRRFVEATRPQAIRVFDVNLRSPFYDIDTLIWGLQQATILKLNEDELPIVLDAARQPPSGPAAAFQVLSSAAPNLALLCLTLGERGCLLATRDSQAWHSGFPTQVQDTVGAGDAFTAALVTKWIAGKTLAGLAAAANRLGSFVASRPGAMPYFPPELIAELDRL